ncbi:MAG: hypothetical protein ABI597_04765 [Gammaproteobacteria bacterium]
MQINHRAARSKLALLVLMFVVPLAASWCLYHYHNYFQLKTLNHGALVNPAIDAAFLYADNSAAHEKKWRVIYVSDASCDTQCEKIQFQLQQVQKAMGKNSDRVDTQRITLNKLVLKKLTTAFEKIGTRDFIASRKIYLIDPLGNLFMYYPETTNPMNVLNDMKRVLEVSQIG